jgi:hypothetical protein
MMHRSEPIYWADGNELPAQLSPEELAPDPAYDEFMDRVREDDEFRERLTAFDRELLRKFNIRPSLFSSDGPIRDE